MKVDGIKGCRACGCKQLEEVLDLGEVYPSNFLPSDADFDEYDKAPLTILQCQTCGLVQLKHSVEPDVMYKAHYWYRSNLNKSMVRDLKDITENIEKRITFTLGDTVLDIGCNDATLLKQYKTDAIINKIGFDPAPNIENEATKNCTYFVNDYFSYDKWPTQMIKAKVITSIAMFYDLENPNEFICDVKKILAGDGIWVIQMTDLLSTLLLNAFDNFCHEHLCYYSLKVLKDLLEKHGLEIFDLEWNSVNGGSLRVYVSHKNSYQVSSNVIEGLAKEFLILNSTLGTFKDFERRYKIIENKVTDFLVMAQANKQTVYGMGASTKGNTLLQKYEITRSLLPYIVEVNKDKFGKVTLGSYINIIPENLSPVPNYFMILPWHFVDMLIEKHLGFLKDGGKFMVPLPVPAVYYYKDDEVRKENL